MIDLTYTYMIDEAQTKAVDDVLKTYDKVSSENRL